MTIVLHPQHPQHLGEPHQHVGACSHQRGHRVRPPGVRQPRTPVRLGVHRDAAPGAVGHGAQTVAAAAHDLADALHGHRQLDADVARVGHSVRHNMTSYASQFLDVFARAARVTHANPVALGAVVLVITLVLTYALARSTVLAYRFVTRGDPPPSKVMVCHTVSPAASEAMKAWAAKLQ